jgi:hypothetical protein
MGLELLEEDLLNDNTSSSSSAHVHEYVNCVSQLRSASSVAIDILNDLLQYDNMKEDKMQIYPSLQPALGIVNETVETFKLQVEKRTMSTLSYGP